MVKKMVINRLFNLILVFFVLFIISIGFYFYLAAKTNVNSITENLELVKDILVEQGLYQSLVDDLSGLSSLLLFQLVAFFLTSLSLLFLVGFIFRLYSIEKKGSLEDTLTKINNRRAIFFGLKRELIRARRFKHPVCIAIADVDFFKQYNDFNGHVAGDRALKRMARIFEKSIRESDMVGRFGGEEFLFIFPETKLEEATRICERIRRNVQKAIFPGEQQLPSKSLTTSLGIAELEKGKSIRNKWQLIDKADKLLYQAKKEGGNIVM